METRLRSALVSWLSSDTVLSETINDVTEEAPSRTALPWLGIAASASTDWSTKDLAGREVRLALELHTRGDVASETATLVAAIEARIGNLPEQQEGFRIITTQFLRARSEQRPRNTRAVLMEYRFRLLAD